MSDARNSCVHERLSENKHEQFRWWTFVLRTEPCRRTHTTQKAHILRHTPHVAHAPTHAHTHQRTNPYPCTHAPTRTNTCRHAYVCPSVSFHPNPLCTCQQHKRLAPKLTQRIVQGQLNLSGGFTAEPSGRRTGGVRFSFGSESTFCFSSSDMMANNCSTFVESFALVSRKDAPSLSANSWKNTKRKPGFYDHHHHLCSAHTNLRLVWCLSVRTYAHSC